MSVLEGKLHNTHTFFFSLCNKPQFRDSCKIVDTTMAMASHTGMELPPQHLIQSEINSVTSAIRKHVRNASSSSFLGGSSNAAGVGPIAGGSSTASLLRSAVASASATSQHHNVNGSIPSPMTALTGGGSTLRVAHGGKMKEEYTASSATPSSARANASRFGFNDSRRDEGVSSLLNGFTILRAQLREAPGAYWRLFPAPLVIY